MIGKIENAGWEIWCGICMNWQREKTKRKEAEIRFRKRGWKKTKENGWVCPQCAGKPFLPDFGMDL